MSGAASGQWPRQSPRNRLDLLTGVANMGAMASSPRIITAAEMDQMTPQERADAVDASIVRNWDDLSPSFRERIVRRAEELVQTHGLDA
jgi:hypothetical protein